MTTDNTPRLWHITLTWVHRKQKYNQEIIVCAPDKDSAEKMSKNRIPIHLLEHENASETIQIRCRDLGMPQNYKTYFTSKTQATAKDASTISLEEQLALTFAVLWGHETGWRAGNPYISVMEQEQLSTLKDFPDKEREIYNWAQQYLSDNSQKPKEFFRQKLSKLLNDMILEVEQMSSTVSINDMESAEQQAREIINTAKKKAHTLLDEYQTKVTNELNIAMELVKQLREWKNSQPAITSTTQDNAQTTEKTLDTTSDTNKEPKQNDPIHPSEKTEPESVTPEIKTQKNDDLPFEDAFKQENKTQEKEQKTTTTNQNQKQDQKSDQEKDEKPSETKENNETTEQKNTEPNPEPDTNKSTPKTFSVKNMADPITKEIGLKDFIRDDIINAMSTLLQKMTVTVDNIEYVGTRVYTETCNKNKIPEQPITEINIELMLDVLNMTNRQNGLSGYEMLLQLVRNEFPGCQFNIPTPNSKK